MSRIAHLFSCACKLRMSSKRKEYHVDCRAAKAAKFFLVCENHIDPGARVKIPAAMMAKGYSDTESKNRTLQMQVRREVEKSGDWIPPALPRQWPLPRWPCWLFWPPQTQQESLSQWLLPMLPLLWLNQLGDGKAAPFCGRENPRRFTRQMWQSPRNRLLIFVAPNLPQSAKHVH